MCNDFDAHRIASAAAGGRFAATPHSLLACPLQGPKRPNFSSTHVHSVGNVWPAHSEKGYIIFRLLENMRLSSLRKIGI